MASSQELDKNYPKSETVDFGVYYLDLVLCPLNSNHKLRRHKLPYHLIKCKKNYPDKVQCPYGHYFYCDAHEMANHLQTCPHKPKIIQNEKMDPEILESQNARNNNLIYNYDINNYEINEPYWD